MVIEKIEPITDILYIGNETIGFVDAIQMCEDMNICGEEISEITEEMIISYHLYLNLIDSLKK